jgi:hypothetical protein
LLDQHLRHNDNYVARFWHGVGRGIYFSPVNTLPCMSAVWPAVAQAKSAAPHELGRRNALAGLAWAVTLVNLRNPEVIEAFVKRNLAEFEGDAFANGVNSALAVWLDWTPDTEFVQRICDYEPSTRQTAFRKTWESQATTHCDGQLTRIHGEHSRRNRREDLFQYHPVVFSGQGN